MSSHREAPEISKDPVADSTDLYAFVTPDRPDTVTMIANYLQFQLPAGGPNFFEFGDDVLYSIFIDNDGDTFPDITYQFQFNTTYQNPDTFLYNTGPIGSLTDQTTPPRGRHCQKRRISARLEINTYVERSSTGGTMRVHRSLNHLRAITLC